MVGAKYRGCAKGASRVNAEERVRRLLALSGLRLGKWLDVGCATGDFMVAAHAKVTEVQGIDISDFAVNETKARGLVNVMLGDFVELEMGLNEFDLVTMWDTVEHVRDPVLTLEKAFRVTKPGGYLVLTTGDIESRIARLLGRFWHLMIPPRHLYFFSPATITRMLMKVGFQSVSVTHVGKRVPMDFLVGKFLSSVVPTVHERVLRMATLHKLGKFSAPVNFSDIMTVYARKP